MPMSAMNLEMVRNALESCGVPLPPDAERAADVLAALHAEAECDVVGEALTAAATSPLTAKNAAKRVQDLAVALVAKDRAVEAARHYEGPVLSQFRDAIAGSIDDLIVAMRPYFDSAAEIFHTAGELVEPGRSVTVSDGAAAVEASTALSDAQARLSQVVSARVRITEMAGYAEQDVTWFIESAENVEALDRARILWKRGAHRLTHAGYRLRLNTRAEAQKVADAAADGTAALAAAAKRARVEANRDPLREAAYAMILGQ